MKKEAYEFLNSARVMHWQYLRFKAKHDELESCLLPGAIRYDKDKVMSSPEDAVSKICSEIADLETMMAKVQIAKAKRIEAIERCISALDSEEERTALTLRFINRKPVSEIALAMGFSEPSIYRFMNEGSKHLIIKR